MEQELLLKPDGIYRRHLSEEFLGDQSKFLRSLAASVPVNLFNVTQPEGAYPYHIQHKAGNAIVYTRLPELRLNTHFRFGGEKKDWVYPCWQKAQSTDFSATFIWTPPAALWFIMMCAPPQPDSEYGPGHVLTLLSGKVVKFYLVMVSGLVGGFFRLPLCNIFEDSSVCMGVFKDEVRTPLTQRFTEAITHFRNSPWNYHLREHSEEKDTMKLVSFTPDGKTLPWPAKWDKHCKKVNNSNYADLPLHHLTAAGL